MRLVAVLTVVAGFALMHAPQCADGMMPTVHLAATADLAMSDMAQPGHGNADSAGNHHPSAIMPGATTDAMGVAGHDDSTGRSALMTCMVLLVSMLGTLVMLRRSLIPLGTRILMRCGSRFRPRTPLRPSLIQLCILRT
ncbi:hypothetical protein [Saccharopolyspora endophytica]|uniref:Uncharacterized protein n=1 Tax=Saccharopolyspora endophytica TaxID=543886 RepID=A0ABS5DQQ7_9PSEU|nr:hypothetical protein [Saccharopolyspora endophytica]MBQ0928654.1 hypothetical protein [Saccharopolyspora endophytica]